MEIQSVKQGCEIFTLVETKHEFQVPFCRPTIRLHLSLISPLPAVQPPSAPWSSPCYTVILHDPQPCCTLAFQSPASRIQPAHSTSSESPPAHYLGFCHCTGILPHPPTSSPIPPPPNTPHCCSLPSTQASLRAAHGISQTLLKSCTGLVWKVIFAKKMEKN